VKDFRQPEYSLLHHDIVFQGKRRSSARRSSGRCVQHACPAGAISFFLVFPIFNAHKCSHKHKHEKTRKQYDLHAGQHIRSVDLGLPTKCLRALLASCRPSTICCTISTCESSTQAGMSVMLQKLISLLASSRSAATSSTKPYGENCEKQISHAGLSSEIYKPSSIHQSVELK
jgi:hypothetical protein